MKALLMFDDRDFKNDTALLEVLERPHFRRQAAPLDEPPVGQRDLIQDLELETVWNAMGRDDPVVYVSARTAMLAGLSSVEQVRYRQAVLTDCLAQPGVAREIYDLAVQAIGEERKLYRSSFFARSSSALLSRSITALEMFVTVLERLRKLTDEHADKFSSKGFTRFFDTLHRELDEDYFDQISQHLRRLRLRDGVLMSARLGKGGQGIDYVQRAPRPDNRRFRFRRAMLTGPTHSHTVPPRDDAGGQALGRLRDRGVTLVANALGQSTDHILSFFTALRAELGFYVGCLNLHDRLATKGEPECLPDPHPPDTSVWSARALYDPCLSLRLPDRVQGNDLRADGKPLLIVTGANQGGKSTFLRSLGVAQLMMQAGMPAPAESFAATIATGMFTHYKREEDATMTSGKFDEELARMSTIVTSIGPGSLLLCNESFAATNEREASEIAGEFIHAMNDINVRVIYVTHLYEVARLYRERHADTTLFLRAERGSDGQRPFRLIEADPLPTSYGADLYRRTFATTDIDTTDTADAAEAPSL